MNKQIDFSRITACGECCDNCKRKEEISCKGCIETDGRCATRTQSGRCKIHTCASEHGAEFCGLCPEFPCSDLEKKIHWRKNAVRELETLAVKYRKQKFIKGGSVIYGAINEKGEKSYTYLSRVFSAIGNRQTEYNWLITDCIYYANWDAFDAMFENDYCWISGEELTNLINAGDYQLVWAVLSAFPKDISKENVLKYPLPYADGNPDFWYNPLTIQHPLAVTEIVSFDSGSTLIFSRDEKTVADFRAFFPYSEDLAEYNLQWN